MTTNTDRQSNDKPRLYRGRRQSWAAPGLVLVSVCDDVPDASRRLLDPRFDVKSESPGGFEWGYPGNGAAQLSLAIMLDHFEHNPHDIARVHDARTSLGKGTISITKPTEAALAIYQDFGARVIATIPGTVSVWSLTTGHVRLFFEHAEGRRQWPPCATHESLSPGSGDRSKEGLCMPTWAHEVSFGDETDRAVAIFIEKARTGTLTALPKEVGERILTAFIQEIRKAAHAAQRLVPFIGAQIGPIRVVYNLLDADDRQQMMRVFGSAVVQAAIASAEELIGIDVLRQVFGSWIGDTTPEAGENPTS